MAKIRSILQDRFGRTIEYLRVSVTDRCDLRCGYCMPKGFKDFERPENWLSLDEIERLVRAFARAGVSKVRLTGGEPLLRQGIVQLAQRIHAVPGIADLSLSTNGTQLERHAAALKRAGVSRLNVSLDSLRPERVRQIAGREVLDKVLAGLRAAKGEGFSPIKINMVVLGGVNDDEIDDMAAFCIEHGFVLRLIETMPIGEAGRLARYQDLRPIRKRLQARFQLVEGIVPGGGPARYLRTPDGRLNVGFITPISQHFCATCNRVRLSVDGTLYLCLGQNDKVNLRPLLRGGASDSELEDAIYAAVNLKPERHEFNECPGKVIRVMARTGG
jgi:cyclic pyranopterin phosphate synthase